MRAVEGVTSGAAGCATAEAVLLEVLGHRPVGQRVVGFEGQQVIGPARQDALGDCGLAAHGVHRHDAVP